jgi:hypothetical protein
MFLRILSAKLSALQNMDKAILSIFKLFNEVNAYFGIANVKESNSDCYKVVEEVSQKIDEGEVLYWRFKKNSKRACLT